MLNARTGRKRSYTEALIFSLRVRGSGLPRLRRRFEESDRLTSTQWIPSPAARTNCQISLVELHSREIAYEIAELLITVERHA